MRTLSASLTLQPRLAVISICMSLLCAAPAAAQTDLGCIGTNGYRMSKSGEVVYSPMLCKFDDRNPPRSVSLEEMKRLYIETLPPELQQEIADKEKAKTEKAAKKWQEFMSPKKP